MHIEKCSSLSEKLISFQNEEKNNVMHDYVKLIKEDELDFDARVSNCIGKTFGKHQCYLKLMQKSVHTYCSNLLLST